MTVSNPFSQSTDNLSAFTHPDFYKNFKYMDDRQGVKMAQTILEKFISSGYQNIIVIESGTSPVIQVIQKLNQFHTSGLTFVQLKIPRNADFNLFEWFELYLTQDEMCEMIVVDGNRISRRDALYEECYDTNLLRQLIGNEDHTVYDSINNDQEYNITPVLRIHSILTGTMLGNIFSQPFLVFDEYVNSGTVLRVFNAMARLFTSSPKYKVSAYCIFIDDWKNYPGIAFCLYDKTSELECFENGAYPYENRIDVIGYYFFVTKDRFEKVKLIDALNELKISDKKSNEFYHQLMDVVRKSDALTTLKSVLNVSQVSDYVTNNDVARYVIKRLELLYGGESKYWDLLDQALEIFAPAWSPMPPSNHLDYWDGIAKIDNQIDVLSQKLLKEYADFRTAVLCDVLDRLVETKVAWDALIDEIIKEENL